MYSYMDYSSFAVKMKSGISNNYQKYDGLRIVTHDPYDLY